MVEIPTSVFIGLAVVLVTGAMSWAAWMTKEGRDRAKESAAASTATRGLAAEVGRLASSIANLMDKQTTLTAETANLAGVVDGMAQRMRAGFEVSTQEQAQIRQELRSHENRENPRLERIENALTNIWERT